MINWIISEAVVLAVVQYGIAFVLALHVVECVYNRCKKHAGIRRRMAELGHKPEDHL